MIQYIKINFQVSIMCYHLITLLMHFYFFLYGQYKFKSPVIIIMLCHLNTLLILLFPSGWVLNVAALTQAYVIIKQHCDVQQVIMFRATLLANFLLL